MTLTGKVELVLRPVPPALQACCRAGAGGVGVGAVNAVSTAQVKVCSLRQVALLELSTLLLMYCLCCLHSVMAELSECGRNHVACRA